MTVRVGGGAPESRLSQRGRAAAWLKAESQESPSVALKQDYQYLPLWGLFLSA